MPKPTRFVAFLCLLLAAPSASAQQSDNGDRQAMFAALSRDVDLLEKQLSIYKRVAQLVGPSVVHVEATSLPQYSLRMDIEEAGSGILVRLRGVDYVLTNRHVIRHSSPELIRLELSDGRQVRPGRIWSDKETDVAVMRIDADGLLPARIGDSGLVEIGDPVLAFGSPFNLRQSVTRGIISAKARSNLDLGDSKGEVKYQNFLQTDAAINPGNSGGPLVNLRGEVIGLNTAIASNSGGNDGIGFSIPINIAVRIMRQLVEDGRVQRGFLGVTLDGYYDADKARAAGLNRLIGARIKRVADSSPAALADLQADDIILRYNGTSVVDSDHLQSLVKLTEIGAAVEMIVLRGGERISKTAQIGGPSAAFTPAP
ncbi:MAG: trypsin-like peptidase domain-containing protein [Planctomycetota bacterium]